MCNILTFVCLSPVRRNQLFLLHYRLMSISNFAGAPTRLAATGPIVDQIHYMIIRIYNPLKKIETLHLEQVVDFLYHHLGEYGDEKSAIRKAIRYAMDESPGKGGVLFVAEENGEIVGTVVINKTGMEEYIPENILVYIATHQEHRGKGIGKQLMEAILNNIKGDIALHVEKDNPAKFLYEKYGFTTPYMEMRLKR